MDTFSLGCVLRTIAHDGDRGIKNDKRDHDNSARVEEPVVLVEQPPEDNREDVEHEEHRDRGERADGVPCGGHYLRITVSKPKVCCGKAGVEERKEIGAVAGHFCVRLCVVVELDGNEGGMAMRTTR